MKLFMETYAATWAEAGAHDLAKLLNHVGIGTEHASGKVPDKLLSAFELVAESANAHPALQRQLLRMGGELAWSLGDFQMPDSFGDKFAYVELVGPKGMMPSQTISCGLYLQQQNTFYPSHWHAAVEDYLVISGTADWQTDDGAFVSKPPGAHIEHASNQPHAMQTLEDPLLAMWFWRGDIRDSTYEIVSGD
jgi:hypothetical protein